MRVGDRRSRHPSKWFLFWFLFLKCLHEFQWEFNGYWAMCLLASTIQCSMSVKSELGLHRRANGMGLLQLVFATDITATQIAANN